MQKASLLLNELLTSDEHNERDYLFHLAVVHTRLNDFEEAGKYADVLFRAEPNNSQVSTLRSVIFEKKTSQTISDVATLSFVSLIGAITIFILRGVFKA